MGKPNKPKYVRPSATTPEAWRVERSRFVHGPGGATVQISCSHRVQGACGGCHARLVLAMALIESLLKDSNIDGALNVFQCLDEAQKSEEAVRRLRGEKRFIGER